MKRILQSLLLLLVLLGVAAGVYQKMQRPDKAPAPAAPADNQQVNDEVKSSLVTVTYFTSDVRCVSCKKIEALTLATVQERFAAELSSGALAFETHNIDQAQNQHFVDDYQLSFKTVVISKPADNGTAPEWQRMDDVWQLLDRPEVFKDYLEAGIREMLSKQA